MPVTQELIENGRVLRVTFTDPWVEHDMTAHFPAAKAYYDAAPKKIHLLVNMFARHASQGALRARYAPGLSHPNAGQIAIAGASALARASGEMVFRLARFNRAKFFDTEDEALAYLRALIAEEEGQELKQG